MLALAPGKAAVATPSNRPGVFPAPARRMRVGMLPGCVQPALRPEINDAAVRRLLAITPVDVALYVGDDRTDLDAFGVVDVRVAVRSDETPDDLLEAADVVVDGTDGLADLLRSL